MRRTLALSALLALAACSGDTTAPTAVPSRPPLIIPSGGGGGAPVGGGGEGDAGAQLACTHFRNVASDVAAGLLTDAELRQKLQEVYSDARVSEEPGVPEGAQEMLAAVTAGDIDRLADAVDDFDAACSAAGF